jgi:hypothetical protein
MNGFAQSFRISKVTLFSSLLALLLALMIRLNTQDRRDACSAYLEGDKDAPPAEYVVSGTRTIVVPCDSWLPRQPVNIQVLCLVNLVLAAVAVLNGLQDARAAFARRRQSGLGRG